MNSAWKIREATTADSEGLKNCMASAYATYQERMGGKRLPPMDIDYLSEIQNYPTWVAESNGSILGGLIMVFEENEASIANIAVNPKSQGEGIGSALMNFAESKAREKHFSELHLATHVLLNENISLYKHLGWEVTERDENRVYMKKVI
jgi:N-acetylglutamate synthase-like GNAT family acetyltransferase